jgi:hypothetical protein
MPIAPNVAIHEDEPTVSLALPMSRAPKILVFDSGLGGLTVCGEVARLLPDAQIIYGVDNAAFP